MLCWWFWVSKREWLNVTINNKESVSQCSCEPRKHQESWWFFEYKNQSLFNSVMTFTSPIMSNGVQDACKAYEHFKQTPKCQWHWNAIFIVRLSFHYYTFKLSACIQLPLVSNILAWSDTAATIYFINQYRSASIQELQLFKNIACLTQTKLSV